MLTQYLHYRRKQEVKFWPSLYTCHSLSPLVCTTRSTDMDGGRGAEIRLGCSGGRPSEMENSRHNKMVSVCKGVQLFFTCMLLSQTWSF